jgi:hypothetical protein
MSFGMQSWRRSLQTRIQVRIYCTQFAGDGEHKAPNIGKSSIIQHADCTGDVGLACETGDLD